MSCSYCQVAVHPAAWQYPWHLAYTAPDPVFFAGSRRGVAQPFLVRLAFRGFAAEATHKTGRAKADFELGKSAQQNTSGSNLRFSFGN